MKVCLYIGNHAADGWLARLGWRITRRVQKGPYSNVTHVEAIHAEHADGSVTIASASLRDGGVRSKQTLLDPANWLIVDVPLWDVARSVDLLATTKGAAYDWRGAVATVFLGSPNPHKWFCSEWCAAPFVKAPATFSPSQFAAICLSLGRDVTQEFFNQRKGP